jgi:hypothetical protein
MVAAAIYLEVSTLSSVFEGSCSSSGVFVLRETLADGFGETQQMRRFHSAIPSWMKNILKWRIARVEEVGTMHRYVFHVHRYGEKGACYDQHLLLSSDRRMTV